jgi:cation:H+ antiporter
MLLDLALVVMGGGLLYKGADWLVDGAARLASTLGISPLVIGLTVVSYGTSAPELAVSLLAALEGKSGIALGNVIGSNIANIGLVLGLTAILSPPAVDAGLFRREIPVLLVATLAAGPVLLNGQIDRYEGLAFFVGAVVFTLTTFKWANERGGKVPGLEDVELPPPEASDGPRKGLMVVLVLVGLAALVLGGEVFVHGSVGIAQTLGLSERVIGLTLVAFGTSLPELAASLMAAYRGHSDLAVGNVVGSNLFNILLILGATSLVTPVKAQLSEVRFDLIVMTLMTFLLAVSLRTARRVTRAEGVLLTSCYLLFIGGLAIFR